MTPKIGIALSGGGVKGFAHLGVLKALEEKGIEADVLAGVSAGAIVGSFIAAGKKPSEVMKLINESDFFDFAKLSLPNRGIFTLDNMTENLKKSLGIKSFEELKIPFYVGAANIERARMEYFDKGDLIKIIQASASIPVLFSPVEINGELYVDGGLFENLPVNPLLDKCDILIAVNVMPVNLNGKLDSITDIAVRTFQLKTIVNAEELKAKADIFIEPTGIEKYNILNTKYSQELYDLGYNYCKNLEIEI
ncbi:MAG: NTE family protein [Halanaerobium sp. 4-GBenrich]|jgi:NTE family protein|uniref:NTE family protein n=1 Tax=Halanaerobium congolense TaxID=54121 RepID=A0A1G9N3N4_9FIRM|nr:patatin-like phospholipase family protein [Halanaerobium congolense]KXS48517.1 MAG: NTE family protein [Halanaerobium sp. T82-1]ODS50661.1 MAG: NTE family protein [Halanaerobium sp. 4-GBenrich]PUU89607.1 MAG: NTE family protein [Halanaerobium sp.]PXV67298.1 NTE family protein [Halanaerobium congolense]TDP16969.1 NTE family protein [Halanaerobium congolense]